MSIVAIMGKAADYRAALGSMEPASINAFLTANSGLPGPRANLELLWAYADVAPQTHILAMVEAEDVYLRCAGTIALGRLLVELNALDASSEPAPSEQHIFDLLTQRAADESWRIREATAMAIQLVGDYAPAQMRGYVRAWQANSHPLVQRAAAAGICEPRLLKDAESAQLALDVCSVSTADFTRRPASTRRDDDVRTLRKALAYCWSVAIAGSPDAGLERFAALDQSDADIAWIVKQNLTKNRLKRLLSTQYAHARWS
jgi:hypothetical protein